MRNKIVLLLLGKLLIFSSCKKEEGDGGMATIKGKVWVHDWDKNFNLLMYEHVGIDEDVFIVYGDQNGYGDKVSTDLNGNFQFNYLRKGTYTIYSLSDTLQSVSFPNSQFPVIAKVEITDKKQVIDIGRLVVNR
ncbi:MAG: hypothetical protein ACKOX3_02600 [Bacteroidota bacterium]